MTGTRTGTGPRPSTGPGTETFSADWLTGGFLAYLNCCLPPSSRSSVTISSLPWQVRKLVFNHGKLWNIHLKGVGNKVKHIKHIGNYTQTRGTISIKCYTQFYWAPESFIELKYLHHVFQSRLSLQTSELITETEVRGFYPSPGSWGYSGHGQGTGRILSRLKLCVHILNQVAKCFLHLPWIYNQ